MDRRDCLSVVATAMLAGVSGCQDTLGGTETEAAETTDDGDIDIDRFERDGNRIIVTGTAPSVSL